MKINNMITVNGIVINNECPDCEGDGCHLEDNTNASGGEMKVYLCDFCDGNGVITENMIDEVTFDCEGDEIIVFKTGDKRYNM